MIFVDLIPKARYEDRYESYINKQNISYNLKNLKQSKMYKWKKKFSFCSKLR